ncbi:hypothetical protein [Telluribacter sp. SYSU D00476]|uniref:hypothetical protein n=1 Tax=Telluribacter sp. SYSU D00476 TaxID=2811430 RepID=UPI001FF69837|nr:hypothetical protein [Telluribacter sp. SYSU D00476]
MTKPLLYLVFLLTLLNGSCKKREPEPVLQELGCLIKAETLNGHPYRSYEYDSQKRLYRLLQYKMDATRTPEKRFTFEYDREGKISIFRETALAAPFRHFQYELAYDSQGRLATIAKSEILNSGPKPVQEYRLEYDEKGRVARYTWDNTAWRYVYDEDNNISKWYVRVPALPLEIALAEYSNYDGKANLYGNSQAAQLINLVIGGGISRQNPGSFKFYAPDGTVAQSGVVTYQYNEFDLPTEASVSLFSRSNAATTQVYGFEYDCL